MAIAFSNSGSNAAITSGAVVVTVTINAGDTVLVGVGIDAAALRSVTVADSASNAGYSQLQSNLIVAASVQSFIWGAVSVASNAVSVTVTPNTTYSTCTVIVLTYTGVGTNGFGNVSNVPGSGSGATTETTGVSTQDGNNFIVTVAMGHNTTGTWTYSQSVGNLRKQQANTNSTSRDGLAMIDNTAVATGALTTVLTSTRALAWSGSGVELRSTNSGGAVTHFLSSLGVGA